jgi:MFS family permease
VVTQNVAVGILSLLVGPLADAWGNRLTLRLLVFAAAIGPLTNTARSDPRPEVRGWAMRSLSEFGTPEAVEVLRVASQSDADQRVRSLAGQLLASHGVAAAPPPVAPPPVAVPAQPVPAQPPAPGVVVQQPVPQAQIAVPPQSLGPDPMAIRQARRVGRGFRLAGWLTFGTTYVLSLSTMAFGEEYTIPAFVPLIGPLISGALLLSNSYVCDWDMCYESDDMRTIGGLSIFLSIAQITGFTLAMVGHGRRRRARRALLMGGSSRERHIAVMPTSSRDGVGLAVSGMF